MKEDINNHRFLRPYGSKRQSRATQIAQITVAKATILKDLKILASLR